ncbi:hypothetical protein AKJ65_05975 [candidate division MSBL1 archaeon SCGC-AAA259E19]|uniref:Uncharacterized protein n=1 Tax=candidate division MSBL1 archaeon SCGC-AAA259E19 TaxID=1698264 RepID=A0A133UHX9_9EURY|nr:hypothetical protein AKJ65_05975 [candidate division MSBL1 archaeon SCGC-AAA259E19]
MGSVQEERFDWIDPGDLPVGRENHLGVWIAKHVLDPLHEDDMKEFSVTANGAPPKPSVGGLKIHNPPPSSFRVCRPALIVIAINEHKRR